MRKHGENNYVPKGNLPKHLPRPASAKQGNKVKVKKKK